MKITLYENLYLISLINLEKKNQQNTIYWVLEHSYYKKKDIKHHRNLYTLIKLEKFECWKLKN